jgi:integrase
MANAHHNWGAPAPLLSASSPTTSTTLREDVVSMLTRLSQVPASELDAAHQPVSSTRTLRQLLDSYLLRLKIKGGGADTMAKNRRELTRFVDFAEQRGRTYTRDLDDDLLLAYAETWEQNYPSSATRCLVRTRLMGFLKFCVKVGSLAHVPDIPHVRQRREPTLPLTPEQFEKLLGSIDRGRVPQGGVPRAVRRAVVLLMRCAGPAITDAVMMQRSSIVYDEAKGFYRCQYRRQKTGILINNPLPREIAEEILAASKLCSSTTHLFYRAGLTSPKCHTRRWTDWFMKAFERVGLAGCHSHQLRDTFAVDLLLKRVPLETVSKALGHTSIKTTERYYAPWIKERQDLLDDTILNAMAGGEA